MSHTQEGVGVGAKCVFWTLDYETLLLEAVGLFPASIQPRLKVRAWQEEPLS